MSNCPKETFTLFLDENIDRNEETLSGTFPVFELTTKMQVIRSSKQTEIIKYSYLITKIV